MSTPATDSTTPSTTTPAAPAASASASPSTADVSSTTVSGEEEVVVGADSTAEYQPVVQLQKVEVQSGEENEDVLYKQRAALYRFDNGEWKERGRGDVKFMQHKDTKKIRVLLRQEKTLKCCMNHFVHPELSLRANAGSDRSWTWRTEDWATDEAEMQTFALRFKDADTANHYKDMWEQYQQHNRDVMAGNKKDAPVDVSVSGSSSKSGEAQTQGEGKSEGEDKKE